MIRNFYCRITESFFSIRTIISYFNLLVSAKTQRPHMSIGYKIPSVVHSEQGQQRIMWKPKKYEEKDAENEKNNTIVKPNK